MLAESGRLRASGWFERDRSSTSHAAVHAQIIAYDRYWADTRRPSVKVPPSAKADQENHTPTS